MIDLLFPAPMHPREDAMRTPSQSALISENEEIAALRIENNFLRLVIAQKQAEATRSYRGCLMASAACAGFVLIFIAMLFRWGMQ